MLDGVNEIIATTLDGEALASIANYGPSVMQHEDVIVRMNYGEPRVYEEMDGKIYLEESR